MAICIRGFLPVACVCWGLGTAFFTVSAAHLACRTLRLALMLVLASSSNSALVLVCFVLRHVCRINIYFNMFDMLPFSLGYFSLIRDKKWAAWNNTFQPNFQIWNFSTRVFFSQLPGNSFSRLLLSDSCLLSVNNISIIIVLSSQGSSNFINGLHN